MIRVFIADDHALVREGVKSLLREENDMSVIAEARDSFELLSTIKDQKCDVVILDISMEGKSGLDALRELKEQFPKLPVVLLTMHPEDRYATRAFKLGASGYVSKESAPRELVSAIRRVITGGKYVSPRFSETLAAGLGGTESLRPHEHLSDREFQIFRLIAQGKTVNDIALALYLSKGTVYTYRIRILKKMNMHGDVELTRYAVENKLID